MLTGFDFGLRAVLPNRYFGGTGSGKVSFFTNRWVGDDDDEEEEKPAKEEDA